MKNLFVSWSRESASCMLIFMFLATLIPVFSDGVNQSKSGFADVLQSVDSMPLSSVQKKRLSSLLVNELGSTKLDEDKEIAGLEQLKVFMGRLLENGQALDEEQLTVYLDILKWHVGNFKSLKPLSPSERDGIVEQVQGKLGGIVSGVVHELYPEIDDELSLELTNAIISRTKVQFEYIGNYFNPQYLYFDADKFDAKELSQKITKHVHVRNASGNLSRLKSLIENPKMPERSRDDFRGFFVSNESFSIAGAFGQSLADYFSFDEETVKGYTQFPEDLQLRESEVLVELKANAEKKQEEFRRNLSYIELIRQIEQESDLSEVKKLMDSNL